MSKYQQIRVRIEPVYPKGLAKAFPKLQRALSGVDNRLITESPPLYELAPLLVALSQSPAADPDVKQAVLRRGQKIIDLHRKIGEAIGGWKLSAAETLLNDLEDAFAELEGELPKL
ncbi:MAG: hypothetical protein ACOZHQ_00255 [Thermodesulfobacteriota bacterium]